MEAPEISVGIMSAKEVRFSLEGMFYAKGVSVCGEQMAVSDEGGIRWHGNLYRELTFTPQENSFSFSLYEVTIGINFHWERQETQHFTGKLKLVEDAGKVVVINILSVEDYLVSVISSEMSAASSLEFLKAHAVISRSWLFAQIERRKSLGSGNGVSFPFVRTETESIRWYDREDHTLFDVCADDHCQRYQGIIRASRPVVAEAVKATRGQLLTANGTVCDARFSKCCGGITEEYATCWESKRYPYLTSVRDAVPEGGSLSDLTREEEADRWIRGVPYSFCGAPDRRILRQVLNDYDRETTADFYRWRVRYTQDELSALVCRNTRMDFGRILDLVSLQRGPSGRICRLRIVGTLRSLVVGKELEIRRILSESHLFSSAFVVDKGEPASDGAPAWFRLIGAGWGHGVGLCQIGAAVMGDQGYDYRDILLHYYKGAVIRRIY